MRLRRLGWAGLELQSDDASIVVDHILDPGILAAFYGPDPDELIAPRPAGAQAALVTHLHRDHADVGALDRTLSPGAAIYRPERARTPSTLDEVATGEAESSLAALTRPIHECAPGDVHRVGPFTITALPAADGLGSPQVSWLIDADGQRVLHAGDTLWHGGWWNIAEAHGPIDVACLPANGAVVSYPQWRPTAAVPAVMTPAQAVEAARAVRANVFVPIHYTTTFEHPDYYQPVHDAETLLRDHAARRDVDILFLAPGDWIDIASEDDVRHAAPASR